MIELETEVNQVGIIFRAHNLIPQLRAIQNVTWPGEREIEGGKGALTADQGCFSYIYE